VPQAPRVAVGRADGRLHQQRLPQPSMSYQVLARKWRPQRFEDVVGQQHVTTTLRNALTSGRLAQAFVFAGARGVGKTTTARILARALNCVNGQTADPCGECEACIEIAQGRDLDVLEIDAATHTGVDNVRDVIISNLAIAPARDRYKVFVIDEVHQLSSSSFNALLKSVEEPPPHVVFIMATTELHKIPDTILSRSQVYEFRTIATHAIAAQLRAIADAEQIDVGDDALALIARYAEGSLRDAESAFDQVISFSGNAVGVNDVATVLGLVGRDLLFDILTAVAEEDVAAAFTLAGRAVESGTDLRILCRELAALVRAMMLVSIDAARLNDPEVVFESDRERLKALTPHFSREDLLRSFDLLAKAEQDVRAASQPRYALEMALVKWIHLRRLVPIGDLIAGLEKGGGLATGSASRGSGGTPSAAPQRPSTTTFGSRPTFGARPATPAASAPRPASPPQAAAARPAPTPATSTTQGASKGPESGGPLPADFKNRFLAEVQRSNKTFYGFHLAQAQKIELVEDRLVLTFGPIHEVMRQQVEGKRGWLESIAESIAGRKVPVATAKGPAMEPDAPRPAAAPTMPVPTEAATPANETDLKARALADSGVQAMLEIFPADIRDVEEIK
jgi:DNA polymerase III subunit gamma/tau